jgi:hypothetical protein
MSNRPNQADIAPAVLNLIAEMQAKILNPDADQFTITLATLTLQGIMPMVSGYHRQPISLSAASTHGQSDPYQKSEPTCAAG